MTEYVLLNNLILKKKEEYEMKVVFREHLKGTTVAPSD